MSRQTRREIRRGEVHGCWTVLRESTRNRYGARQWMCRASCCGREVARAQSDIERLPAPVTCNKCKVWGAARSVQAGAQ